MVRPDRHGLRNFTLSTTILSSYLNSCNTFGAEEATYFFFHFRRIAVLVVTQDTLPCSRIRARRIFVSATNAVAA